MNLEDTTPADTPVLQPQVSKWMEELYSEIEKAKGITDHLETRLDPVLRSDEVAAQGKKADDPGKANENLVPLAQVVQALTFDLRKINDRNRDIMDRLEL